MAYYHSEQDYKIHDDFYGEVSINPSPKPSSTPPSGSGMEERTRELIGDYYSGGISR